MEATRKRRAGGEGTYTPAEAADEIGVHVNTVYALVQNGVLPRVPDLGKKILISKEVVRKYLAGELHP